MFGQTNSLPARNSIRLKHYFAVTADFTSATWNTVASHEIATVTGMVYMFILPECTATLTDAADLARIQLGMTDIPEAIIGSTGAAGLAGSTINVGELWFNTTPSLLATQINLDGLRVVVANGNDVGYEITGAALTGGTMIFHVWWEALDSTGAVVAGAGGVL